VSRSGRGFGAAAYRELKAKGYVLHPVHREAPVIEGDAAVPSLKALAGQVGGVLVVTPPAESARVVRDAVAAGIGRVWLQQGAQSEEAVGFCRDNGVTVIAGECVLMFAEPTRSFHKAHRFFARVFGRLPG
jgi:predicted CoA-binding protein